jgi:hypothetical protein
MYFTKKIFPFYLKGIFLKNGRGWSDLVSMFGLSSFTCINIIYLPFTSRKVTPTAVIGRPRQSEKVSKCLVNRRLQALQTAR